MVELEKKISAVPYEKKNQELTEELLAIYRKDISYRLILFYQDREVDGEVISQKYGQDYRTILKEKLTLTNRKDMEEAFKVVACICAVEKLEKMSDNFKSKNLTSDTLIKPLLERLNKLKKA